MCWKWRFIHMVTQSHTLLKENEITEDLSGWDSSGSNLNTKCMEDKSHKGLCSDNVINIQHFSTLRK